MTKAEQLTKAQHAHLLARLNEATRELRPDYPDGPLPVELRRQEAAIERFRERRVRAYRKSLESINASRRKVEQAILFASPQEALKAVERFEKGKGN